MSRIRSIMAVFLLGWGGLLMAAQFAPAGNLISNQTTASCHEDSGAPLGKAPLTHDCCAVGHLRAVVMAVSVVPQLGFACLAFSSGAGASAHDRRWTPAQLTIDTGPGPSAAPIRI